MNTNTSDQDLVIAICNNDRAALGKLYDRYYKKVFNKCYSFTKDEGEAFDLAQEALLKAFDHIRSFKGESSFSTWLYTITHRHCLAALKKNGRFRFQALKENESLEDLSPASQLPDEGPERAEKELIMYSLINALPAREKDLLHAKYLQGESIECLQEHMHLSGSAVKMRLKRTREKLNVLYAMALTYGLDQVLDRIELFTAG